MLSIDDFRLPDEAPQTSTGTVPDLVGLDLGLPANVHAEKTILGAVLLDNEALKEAQTRLEPDDFSLDSHRRIFQRMGELADTRHGIDMITLANDLASHHEIDKVGGVAYLASLTEDLPRRPVIHEYIAIVKDKCLARRLMTLGSLLITQAGRGDMSAALMIEVAAAQLAVLAEAGMINSADEVLVRAVDFAAERPAFVEWLVDGVIQRNGNGIFAADGKTGKSLLVIHLLLHLASGTDWLGLKVPGRVSCALISREDDPGETARRIGSFVAGCAAALKTMAIEEYFWLNTRAQTPTFTLENKREIAEIIAALKQRKVEFAVFDVFRSIWTGDENDNSEVAKVLEALRRIQREAGCAVGLVHHLNKSEGANIFAKLRGASAIRGWQEWGFALQIVNPEDDEDKWVRQIRFETKAARPHRRMFYAIQGPESAMKLELCEDPALAKKPAKPKPKPKTSGVGALIVMPAEKRTEADD